MNTFIIADNQYITRQGLISLLESTYNDSRIITAATRNELQKELRVYLEATVILDYTLFDFSSVNQLLNMKSGAAQSSWLLFSDELNEYFLRQVLISDQTINVVMKSDRREQILEAITCTLLNKVYRSDLSESILKSGVAQNDMAVILTASEKSILREIALGKTTKEIAEAKNLSFHTINTHRRNIFRKIAVNNVHEATKYALQAGLIDLVEYYI